MLSTRSFGLMVMAGSLLTCPMNEGWSQEAGARVEPFLRLEKPKYLLGESILYWVGFNAEQSTTIRAELKKPCTLRIDKPDGATETQSIPLESPPILEATHVSGGAGLGGKEVQTGAYILSLECAGKKTKPVELVVEKNSILDQLQTEFRFERSGSITMDTSIPVVFSVQNNSEYPIVFPKRGTMGDGIGVAVDRQEPRFGMQSFYPFEKLAQPGSVPKTYNWDSADSVESVRLGPGERFEQRFLLEDAYEFDLPGHYEVSFNTLLLVIVGEKDGPFADYCPIRLVAKGEATFEVAR
jgi:hypothetical protein